MKLRDALCFVTVVVYTQGVVGTASNAFISVKEDAQGRLRLFDPNRNQFFVSTGVTCVNYLGDFCPVTKSYPYGDAVKAKYDSEQAWANATSDRMRAWGINTLAAWTYNLDVFKSQNFYYALELGFSGLSNDWFSEEFASKAIEHARKAVLPHSTDPNLIGYFVGNEISWGTFVDQWPVGFRETNEPLIHYLRLPENATGFTVATDFLMTRYHNNLTALNSAWKIEAKSWASIAASVPFKYPSLTREQDEAAFAIKVAERYFNISHSAVRQFDKLHLTLGCRYSFWELPIDVVAAESKYTDVISFNGYIWYPGMKASHVINDLHARSGKPVLISEFAFRAFENQSKDPNLIGAGWPVLDQSDRAKAFTAYVEDIMHNTNVTLGYHWFQWSDEPAKGRFDGEDSNFGLVDIHDNDYTQLTQAMSQINTRVYNG